MARHMRCVHLSVRGLGTLSSIELIVLFVVVLPCFLARIRSQLSSNPRLGIGPSLGWQQCSGSYALVSQADAFAEAIIWRFTVFRTGTVDAFGMLFTCLRGGSLKRLCRQVLLFRNKSGSWTRFLKGPWYKDSYCWHAFTLLPWSIATALSAWAAENSLDNLYMLVCTCTCHCNDGVRC